MEAAVDNPIHRTVGAEPLAPVTTAPAQAAGQLKVPRSRSRDMLSSLASPARKLSPQRSTRDEDLSEGEPSDDESASSAQLSQAKSSKASKKDHKDKDKERKKKPSLSKTHDGLAQRKSKKHGTSDSEDDKVVHRRSSKAKTEARSPNSKSPKKGITTKVKSKKSRSRRRTPESASESSESTSASDSEEADAETHGDRTRRRKSGARSVGTRSRSGSRGSSQERKVDNSIRRTSRASRPVSSGGSSEGTPDTGLTSPKGEEIGRMHKEIETLKSLTKILEEKLEILEHIPDDAEPVGGSDHPAQGHHGARRSLANSTSSVGHKMSDSSDGVESTRKKVKPRHTTSMPAAGRRTEYGAYSGEGSRSTADLTKHGRRREQKQRRAARSRKPRSDSDATSGDDHNSGDSSSDTDSEPSSMDEAGGERKLRKSISLTGLRDQQHGGHVAETEVGNIKKERDREHKLMKQRAVRERARGKREHDRSQQQQQQQRVASPTSVPYVSPYGNTPTTKSLEYCYSCLMKTDISSDGDRKLWKRRVLGFGSNGLNLIKPYTEQVEQLWAWATIQQWIINDEQNLIKFMIEEDAKHQRHHHHASSSDSEHSSSEAEQEEGAAKSKLAIYTFRVDDVNKVNDSLWRVVKRVQKKRRGLELLGTGSTRSHSSTQSSARNSDDEDRSESTSSDDDHAGSHHHHFKESVQSLFKALTHSLGHGHGRDHRDKDNKDRERK